MKIFIKRLYRLIIALSKINWYQFVKQYNRSSKNIIWIVSTSPHYFFTTSILWDLASIKGLIDQGQSLKVVFGKKIGKQNGKIIIYTIHSHYNIFNLYNYTDTLLQVLSQLSQTNKLFPPLCDAKFWENKAYMHREFERLGLPSPETKIFTIRRLKELNKTDFPYLLKRIHSCESKGLFKISSENELQSIIQLLKSENQEEEILVQNILNMRRDIRVILVGGKVVHYYWRINLTDTWRPTATNKGNMVDFENFPEKQRTTIENYFRELKLTAGAFDIAWQNDDITGTPFILEVSPVFSPNPTTFSDTHLANYGEFKKQVSFKGYDYFYVKEIFRIKKIHLLTFFDKVR